MIYHTFFFPFGGLVWTILIVILIAYIWKESRQSTGPENMLAERFAKGEITEAEYTERLEVLKKRR